MNEKKSEKRDKHFTSNNSSGMESSFVQTASLNEPGSKQQVTFTNLSSQQMTPGILASFHQKQDASMQPMPFSFDSFPQGYTEMQAKHAESDVISAKSRMDTIQTYFQRNTPSTRNAVYRSPAQRAWNVPDHLLECWGFP